MIRVALCLGLTFVSLSEFQASEATDSADVQAVDQVVELLCEKQVAALGELPSHGEAEAFRLKAEVVTRLIEKCGFDALLFEAPIYDFFGFEQALKAGTADQAQLDRALGGFWTTRGLADWRRTLFELAKDGRLRLGGLDDQVSATSEYARSALPELVSRFSPSPRRAHCRESVERNLFWRYGDSQGYDHGEKARLSRCSVQAAAWSERAADEVERRMLLNLKSLYARQAEEPDALDRDAQMAQNLLWHQARWSKGRRAPGSRIILWTSTVHAARRQGELKQKPVGEYLVERLGDRYAGVGFSAREGAFARRGMQPRELDPLPDDALEALVVGDASFFSGQALSELGSRPSRLLGAVVVADWSSYFDAVVVIREERAPTFEP